MSHCPPSLTGPALRKDMSRPSKGSSFKDSTVLDISWEAAPERTRGSSWPFPAYRKRRGSSAKVQTLPTQEPRLHCIAGRWLGISLDAQLLLTRREQPASSRGSLIDTGSRVRAIILLIGTLEVDVEHFLVGNDGVRVLERHYWVTVGEDESCELETRVLPVSICPVIRKEGSCPSPELPPPTCSRAASHLATTSWSMPATASPSSLAA